MKLQGQKWDADQEPMLLEIVDKQKMKVMMEEEDLRIEGPKMERPV